jgi:hypothetical protein
MGLLALGYGRWAVGVVSETSSVIYLILLHLQPQLEGAELLLID